MGLLLEKQVMADSMNLISAQISFLEPRLALVHIPIELYTFCLQPILQLLFGEDHDEDAAKISWTNQHDFLNVSITPVECSIICSRQLANRFVCPVAQTLNRLYGSSSKGAKPRTEVQISSEDYIAIQVDGQGLDAGQRVLELTSPLAMAGISIFFITTYFSDYILVPFRSHKTVTKALQQRGFVFSQSADAFVSQLSPSSPTMPQGIRPIGSPPFHENSAPTTPPAKDLPELQIRTFTKLTRNNISPLVDSEVRLANCAGSREPDAARDEQLKNDLLQVLIATSYLPEEADQCKDLNTSTSLELGLAEADATDLDFGANFLSLTITAREPISVLLEHRLLDRLGGSLLGAKSEEDALIPITLDLRDLPLDATGIVCGVAGRLAQGSTDEFEQLNLSPVSEGR
ncbi:hypothetical protein, variant [Exophiala xenobiotica]|uniref:CASTOR ACT domain-containing protein n=1 Tax=Exophiala xenobiotica TaxID=348802 RepID=A0A0D2EGZ8_9EURO|nr:hypothetical protein, variant [Exophiala xenobiotica]KIW53880.1 hypothetical protein, variant [Exophiala xenobiotica]